MKIDIETRSIHPTQTMGDFCDRGIFYSLCVLVFVLPASIALLDSFAALTVIFYLLKKINKITVEWPRREANGVSTLGKLNFIWKSFAPPANPLNRPLQLLTLAVFISVLFSQFPGLSLYAFAGKFLKVIFLYFSFIEAVKNEKRIRIFLYFFLASAFITAFSGFVQHYSGTDFLKGHLLSSERVNSSFFTANGFGAYLLPVIALVTHILFTAIMRYRSWILGIVMGLFLVLLLACLCWTYSRSAWLGYLLIMAVMVLLDWRKIFFAAALLLVFIFVFLPFLNQVRNCFLVNDNSSGVRIKNANFLYDMKPVLKDVGSGRVNYWKKAISIIRSSPVYGTGLNTYTRVIHRDSNPDTWWYAHNGYLQMAAETGLLGLGSFLWVIFVLFQNSLKYCRIIKDFWPLTFLQGAISGLSGFLAQSFLDNTFFTVQLGILMWLIFGLLVALMRLQPQSLDPDL